MNRSLRRIAFMLLQTVVATAAAGPSDLGQSPPQTENASGWMPVSDVQPLITTDTPSGVPKQPSQPDIGPLAQASGVARNANDNFPPPPSRNDGETPTLVAIKALADQVKSLESRIAAQDARIATLERALEDMRHQSTR
jgi:hypothetical protein